MTMEGPINFVCDRLKELICCSPCVMNFEAENVRFSLSTVMCEQRFYRFFVHSDSLAPNTLCVVFSPFHKTAPVRRWWVVRQVIRFASFGIDYSAQNSLH